MSLLNHFQVSGESKSINTEPHDVVTNHNGVDGTIGDQRSHKISHKRSERIKELIEQWDKFVDKMEERKKCDIDEIKRLTEYFINKCKDVSIGIKTIRKIIKAKADNLYPQHLFETPFDFCLYEPHLLTYKQACNIESKYDLHVSKDKKIDAWINYAFSSLSHISQYKLFKGSRYSPSLVEKAGFTNTDAIKIKEKLVRTVTKQTDYYWNKEKREPNPCNNFFWTTQKIINRENVIEEIIRKKCEKQIDYKLSDTSIEEIRNNHIEGKLSKKQGTFVKMVYGLRSSLGGKAPQICGLTGGPGTGKSWALKTIIDIELHLNPQSRILGTALAGMAVNALNKSTDLKIHCGTLHKEIIYGSKTIKVRKNQSWTIAKREGCSYLDVYHYFKTNNTWPENRIELNKCSMVYDSEKLEKELNFHYDLVFIDETTMINIFLLEEILVTLVKGNPDIRIIFIGDKNQLPSIGPGKFFKDLLNNARLFNFMWVELTKIQRQKNIELIQTISDFLDEYKEIPSGKWEHEGYKFIKFHDDSYKEELINIIENKRKELIDIHEKWKDDELWGIYVKKNFQILSPQKKGISGIIDINNIIQGYLMRIGLIKSHTFIGNTYDTNYYVGDKIINTRNDYDSNPPAYNGQMGEIIEVVSDDFGRQKSIKVKFYDNPQKDYIYEDVNDLKYNSELAYCVSIHKSQGSGFKNVILFVNEHSSMWPSDGKPLLYTGASRCKEELYIIGDKNIIKKAKKSPDQIFTSLFKHGEYY